VVFRLRSPDGSRIVYAYSSDGKIYVTPAFGRGDVLVSDDIQVQRGKEPQAALIPPLVPGRTRIAHETY
jgi:hypothetical protein